MFQHYRPTLLGVAYRTLGSLTDAEDVVQEAWLRWAADGRNDVQSPRQYLITVVTRLSIDRVRLMARRKETYVGPWLPEPVHTTSTTLGPAETAAQRDTLSLATLRLLERLSAPERAVFVLREAFELPYAEIGRILELTEANARQLHRRGCKHLAAGPHRYAPDPETHRALVERFLTAASTGDRGSLQSLLAHDATLWSDGGGKVRAALQAVIGDERITRLLSASIAKHVGAEFHIDEINGQPALLVRLSELWHVCSFEITDDRISGIQWMSNPDKLERLTRDVRKTWRD